MLYIDLLNLLALYNLYLPLGKVTNKEQWRKLSKLLSIHNFEQFIVDHTRVTETSSTLSDLLFSNITECIVDHGGFPLNLSDHSLIYCVYKAGQFKSPGESIIKHCSFKHYTKPHFINDLKSVDWSSITADEDLDQAVFKWNACFTTIIDNHAPNTRYVYTMDDGRTIVINAKT